MDENVEVLFVFVFLEIFKYDALHTFLLKLTLYPLLATGVAMYANCVESKTTWNSKVSKKLILVHFAA